MRKIVTFTTTFIVTGVLLTLQVSAQSTSQPNANPGSATPQQVDNTFEGRFWQYLTASTFRYDEWAPFAGRSDELYKGQSPHGAFVRVFANKMARQNSKQPPYGSILIKENYGADGKTLMAITVMYRTRGQNGQPWDPENRDWYYVKYTPSGQVASSPPEMGSKRLAGRVQSCIDCHSGAGGKDFVYLNDDLK
ncbi:MAG: cytochrome P460 family protein [Planctomycetota bacterium]|nr:cytochrome P460 family protein [Planctomycetota bacterium]